MRRIGIIVIVMLFFVTGVISFASLVYGQSAKKVLMIPREGYSEDLDLLLKNGSGCNEPTSQKSRLPSGYSYYIRFPIMRSNRKNRKTFKVS